VPADCSSSGPSENTVATFGANGILGVSIFAQDCGPDCVSSTARQAYYACSSTACTVTMVDLQSQVPNPATLFATDNNGVIIQLPSVAVAGQASVTGNIVFGIDTQSNNASGNQTLLPLDANGNLSTQFDGTNYADSFFDTGSNGLFFTDASIKVCPSSQFYCPPSTLSLSATVNGAGSGSAAIKFSVADADTLGADDMSLIAFPNLAGTNSDPAGFDWGLPFFYGRNVYTAFEGKPTAVGTGPYIAF
jgi:Protein of unknown function (DUF3443)